MEVKSASTKRHNCAGRLYDLLVRAKQQNPNQQVRDGLSGMFGCQPADSRACLARLADLTALVTECREAVNEKLASPEMFLHGISTIDNVLGQLSLNSSWQTLHGTLNDMVVQHVWFAADALRTAGETEPASGEELATLVKSARTLIDELAASSMPSQLKAELVEAVETVERTLRAYDLRGPKAARKALHEALGILLDRMDEIKASGSGAQAQSVFVYLKLADRFVNVANGVLRLATNVVTVCQPLLSASH